MVTITDTKILWTRLMLIEPHGVVNTGDNTLNDLTAKNDVWI